jgi:hypothetical protein
MNQESFLPADSPQGGPSSRVQEGAKRRPLPMRSPLDSLRIASPCQVSWDEMTGDDRVRFCPHCRLNVIDLSAMSRHDAEELLLRTTGRLCVRYYQRSDGTVMTQDCPQPHLRAAQVRAVWAASLLLLLSVAGGFGMLLLQDTQPVKDFLSGLFPQPKQTQFMGAICPPANGNKDGRKDGEQ